MADKIELFNQPYLKKNLPDIRPGDTVCVYQKIREALKKDKSSSEKEEKERVQIFEGIVIARKHGKGISGTITVRKVISGIGVEKVFPIHSPTIEKIEIIKRGKVRRAKLYYLRTAKGKKAKLKMKEFAQAIAEEEPTAEASSENNKNEENIGGKE